MDLDILFKTNPLASAVQLEGTPDVAPEKVTAIYEDTPEKMIFKRSYD